MPMGPPAAADREPPGNSRVSVGMRKAVGCLSPCGTAPEETGCLPVDPRHFLKSPFDTDVDSSDISLPTGGRNGLCRLAPESFGAPPSGAQGRRQGMALDLRG
jgi:hypothetical protein